MSDNRAAQLHAEDMLKTRTLSHWTTDGMKPYMRYIMYGGTGDVSQNIADDGYDSETISKCKSNEYNCSLINATNSIDRHEYNMVYNDSKSNWGHRYNILDKHHTHVSIGIAYDDYYFAFVQNFENNYIQSDGNPIIQVDSNKNVQIRGSLTQGYDSNNILNGIGIYYDETPNQLIYEQHKDDTFYELGKQIALIVKPLPPNYHYEPSAFHIHPHFEPPSNYTLIQADKWWTSSSEGNQRSSFDIQFNISNLLTTQGVYTIVIYIKNNYDNKDIFPIWSYSIFVRNQ